MTKYSEGSVRHIDGDRWQARFCYYGRDQYDREVRKYVSRNFRATSQRAAPRGSWAPSPCSCRLRW